MPNQNPPLIMVFCTVVEDDSTAKLCGHKYFCEVCGDTEHEQVSR